ncbi:MAG: DDE-type integrase/transposase/recombinase [Gemmatimonadales bacterium]
MSQRLLFIRDFELGVFSFSALCARYGVSRETGYAVLARYRREGRAGLETHSRRPHHSPRQTPSVVIDQLVEARQRHPTWGPKKLLWLVRRRAPTAPWPAPSTVGLWLTRRGLIRGRRRRRALTHPGRPGTIAGAPNALWTLDFKGQFRTRDGAYCYPLTVADDYSRYLLGCQALLQPTRALVRPVLTRLFQAYGLPERIRTDNGAPFASCALARLSQLSVWFLQCGIHPELIEPGHPEQNPRHERMHRTLKAATTRPPAADHRAQQRCFNAFRAEFNAERPHESLGMQPPATLYRPSPRSYRGPVEPLTYPGHFELRKVSRNGGIRWQKAWVNVSHVLAEETVGLEAVADGLWDVYYRSVKLGRFSERTGRIEDDRGRLTRRRRLSTMSPV